MEIKKNVLKYLLAIDRSLLVKMLIGFDRVVTKEYTSPTMHAKNACMIFMISGALKKSGSPVCVFVPYGLVLILSCKTDHDKNDP